MPETAATKVARLGRRVRVLIADDHRVIRRAVRSTLQIHPEIEVCGEATDGAEAVEEAKKFKPDGSEAAREIKMILPEAAIVILSHHADREFVEKARRSLFVGQMRERVCCPPPPNEKALQASGCY